MYTVFGVVAGAVASSWYSHRGNTQCASKVTNKSPFSQEEYRSFQLINVYDESHDTKVFRFALPEADMPLNLDIASCITLRYVDKDGNEVVRPYTPISRSDQLGFFDVLVKRYSNSKMGSHMFALKKGDVVEARGPWMKLPIRPNQYKTIGMIAGGTGITPMYQVARNLLRVPNNTTDISLIYANRRKEDVLLGNELNELMEQYTQFNPYYVLSHPPSDWMGGVGHVNKEMIKSLMPPLSRAGDSVILVCGPPPFMETICGDKDFTTSPPSQGELRGYLKELGYSPRMVYKF